MYVETMTTEEKLNEFKKAFDQIEKVAYNIVSRVNPNKIKVIDRKICYGIHKLNISGTEYFYSMYIIKTKNTKKYLTDGKYVLLYDFLPYTIQTHRDSGNKYIISFGDFKRKPEDFLGSRAKYRSTISVNMIVEYEYHLIKRYAERFLKDLDMSADDALMKFLETNQDGVIQFYGKYKGLAARISENGICLGEKVDDTLIKFKTFITEEDLREDQKEWSKYGDIWNLFIELRKRDYKNPFIV